MLMQSMILTIPQRRFEITVLCPPEIPPASHSSSDRENLMRCSVPFSYRRPTAPSSKTFVSTELGNPALFPIVEPAGTRLILVR